MKVTIDLAFKTNDGILNPERIHHLYIPAVLATSDGSLETKGMTLNAFSVESLTVYTGSHELDTGYKIQDNVIFRYK